MSIRSSRIVIVVLLLVLALIALGSLSTHTLRLRGGIWLKNTWAPRGKHHPSIKPVFTYLPDGWVTPIRQSMDETWLPLGLLGVNYYTFAGPRELAAKYSLRSDPDSEFYQAWFGTYLVANGGKLFAPHGEMDQNGLLSIALNDQKAWLKAMGDPNPTANLRRITARHRMMLDGVERIVWELEVHTHSDLSTSKERATELLGMPPQRQWQDKVHEYHGITLKAYYCPWFRPEEGAGVVVYGAGAVYGRADGQIIDHTEAFMPILREMIQGVRIVQTP